MTGSNNVGGKGAGLIGATGAAVLPFTSGNSVAMYIAITAVVCAGIVLLSKLVKHVATR